MRHLPIAALLIPAAAAAQNLVLPDNHYLMERSDQLANSGDNNVWGTSTTTGRRAQILYEASHFLNAGITGPVLITHLRFRGEDGEPNLGGQLYNGVVVRLGSTALAAGGLTTTFATNLGTASMGPAGTANVAVAPSIGTCPNNYCIDIDLLAIGAAILHDPTSALPNLLIDLDIPAVVHGLGAQGYMIPIQDTTAHGIGIRGNSVTAAAGATTGTLDTTPPVVGLGTSGPGGYATPIPARNEEFGAACGGSCSTFYQTFNQGQPFDLTGLTLIPDNPASPNVYTVVGGAPPVDLTKLNATPSTATDESVITQALSFTWRYPGGSTTTIKPSSNGHIWLDAAMTSALYTVNKPSLLGTTANYTARYLVFWTDLHCTRNQAGNPLAGLHVKEDTSGGPGNTVVYVTWYDVSLFRVGTTAAQWGHCSFTFQCVMHEATGIVEYRYGPMNTFASGLWTTSTSMYYASMVGFTRGRIAGVGSQDPQSRDLSHEVPFTTGIEGATSNVGLSATATPIAGGVGYFGRMFGGQSMTWTVSNIPAGTVFAMLNLDLTANQPGLQIPTITAPGCVLSTSLSPVATGFTVWALPVGTATSTPLPIPAGVYGADIIAQAVGLDLFGGPSLLPWTSNAIRHTVGLN
jgi:hypothetical protein